MMRKAQALVVLTFVALFGAGAVSTLVATRLMRPSPPTGGGSFLRDHLGLTREQHLKMQEIWSAKREADFARNRQRRALFVERDEAFKALLTPEQRAQYDQILARHDAALVKLRDETDAAMQDAIAKTRALLTNPGQLARYDELLKQRPSRGDDLRSPRDRFRAGTRPTDGPPPPPSPPEADIEPR